MNRAEDVNRADDRSPEESARVAEVMAALRKLSPVQVAERCNEILRERM